MAVAAGVVAVMRRHRLTDVVLAPGSRSAPLALAMFEADDAGEVRLHVRIDERTAGFLALGLVKGSHRPVVVVTTSGSAVAQLHPALLEAQHVGEPVILISADRPASLRGTGANQTTCQVGMFGPRIPCTDVAPGDVASAVRGIDEAVHRRGPTHVNLQFAEPLVPVDGDRGDPPATTGGTSPPPKTVPPSETVPPVEILPPGPRTVLVAGDGAGPPARLLAERARWPLLAEPTSGARTGRNALRTYRLLLAGRSFARRIERVVIVGHPTLSRPVTRLLSRNDLEVISVRGPGGICTDPGRVARHVDVLPTLNEPAEDGWLEQWRVADADLSREVDAIVDNAGPDARALQVAAEVAAATAPGGLLFVGSSSPIRDLDVMGTPYPVGERRLVIGNRGLSGIDGSVSTALGAALGRKSSRAVAYLGDLTFLHDANGLVIGPDEPRPALTFVIPNDDGGAIFTTLEPGEARFAASFERLFGTPHRVSLGRLCAATGTAYERIEHVEQLRERLADDPTGIRVLEVPVSRAGRRELGRRLDELALRLD
jgi:2-succinyl-5-enolpyruvyl-6-hydroxy-3-cyclohexene-1-carboxylate synthase